VNQGQAVPAQVTEQADAGLKYEIAPGLQLVGGYFEIRKPYFDLDDNNIYRQVGNVENKGFEFSLAGQVSPRFSVVAGLTLIDARVTYDTGLGGNHVEDAIGPVPVLLKANLEYRSASIPGLVFIGKLESFSKRYANYDSVELPEVTIFGAGVRYDTSVLARNATFRMEAGNLTGRYGLTPAASGKITPFDGRSIELSFAIDL
jgi:iron complex outermembrane recepter protein